MAALLDIILAFSLGGFLLIIIFNAYDISSTQTHVLNGDMLVQQMLVSLTQFLEGEFRNMGYRVAVDDTAIAFARDSAIFFWSDVDNNGVVDFVRYYAGPISDLASTQNDSDRLLYRRVNAEPRFSVGSVTRFSLQYFSQGQIDTFIPPPPGQTQWIIKRSSGTFTEDDAFIDYREFKVIQLSLEVQNPYALYKRRDDPTAGREALYSSSMWRQTRLASQNLRR